MAMKRDVEPRKPGRPRKRIGAPPHDNIKAYERNFAIRMESGMFRELECRGDSLSDGLRTVVNDHLALLAEGRRQLRDMPWWKDRKNLKKILDVYEKHGMDGVLRLRPATLLQRTALLDAIKRFVKTQDQTIDNLLR